MDFKRLIDDMGKHSISELPKEACGIITKDFYYVPTKNISKVPTKSFIIDPLSILEHENNIWGFFHSHPYSADPIPSSADVDSTIFSEYRFIVGFANNFYIYWNDNSELRFERFNETHCKV